MLLEAGADVELPSKNSQRLCALHVAATHAMRSEGLACVAKLLNAGANPCRDASKGRTAAEAAQGAKPRKRLRKAEEKWLARDGERTCRPALVHAVALNREQQIHDLLAVRTHPDSNDEHGTCAIHAACTRGDEAASLVKVLIQAGASVNRHSRDRLGSRPLHCAAQVSGAHTCTCTCTYT